MRGGAKLRLKDLYDNIISAGMKNDPRRKSQVKRTLSESRKRYRSLKGRERSAFDTDRLFNPYNDTRVLCGDMDSDIRSIMVGIDIETPELLMADSLIQKGIPIDLVMSHHPHGRAFADLYEVMNLQTDLLKGLGMKEEAADKMMGERIEKVSRGLHAKNCTRSIDAARILNIAFMCVHTAADNMVCSYLQKMLDRKRPRTLGALTEVLNAMPEYKEGSRLGVGPKILLGDKKKKAGRIYVDMTGGTEGSNRIFSRLSQMGIETVVGMHFSEEHFKEAKKEYMNVVVAGHIPSDNIGLNLMLDELSKKERFDIIPCSGFMRLSRL
jgi:hypothetical protein